MLRTPICDLLQLEYPVFQGGMAHLATGSLAAAVSEAGGLGIIGAGNAPASWVKEQIDYVRARTGKPFGVNVMLQSPHAREVIELLVSERVPVVTTGAGNPGPYMEALKGAGSRVIPVVSAVALAQRLVRSGADAVIAEGMESGGHVGEMTTMALVPQVVDAVDVPVIAAGGIADGRGVAAAFCLGAQGVQLGTRFVVAKECIAHESYKQAIIKAGDRDTVVTGRATGHPVRCLRNKLAREFLKLEERAAAIEEYEQLGVGRYPAAVYSGDIEHGTVLAGQISGLVKKEETAADILADLMSGAEAVLAALPGRLNVTPGAAKG
ncbi:MAG: enoyl-[acyl-carrier-protein] reductase FabK [Chloroflexota bacterium]